MKDGQMGAGGNGSVGSVIVENSCQWDERDGGNPCCCFSNFFFFFCARGGMGPLWIPDTHAFTLKSYGFTDLMCIQTV